MSDHAAITTRHSTAAISERISVDISLRSLTNEPLWWHTLQPVGVDPRTTPQATGWKYFVIPNVRNLSCKPKQIPRAQRSE